MVKGEWGKGDKNIILGYIYVLDAKNYVILSANKIESLPMTESIGKQYLYKHFLSQKLKVNKSNIINAFLFPALLQNENIKYIDYFKFNDCLDINKDILCFQVDFFKLRKAYIYCNKSFKDGILDYILKVFKE